MRARLNPTRGEEFKYTSFATYTPPISPSTSPSTHAQDCQDRITAVHASLLPICTNLAMAYQGFPILDGENVELSTLSSARQRDTPASMLATGGLEKGVVL